VPLFGAYLLRGLALSEMPKSKSAAQLPSLSSMPTRTTASGHMGSSADVASSGAGYPGVGLYIADVRHRPDRVSPGVAGGVKHQWVRREWRGGGQGAFFPRTRRLGRS
jgi:hypothetical protein